MMKTLTIAMVVLGLPGAPAFADNATSASPGGNPEGPPPYVIGSEDVLQIAVWNNEALSRTVPVRPDGMISLPLLNDVQAAGLTPMQLRDTLLKRLTEYIPSPEVAVIVTDVRSLKVAVVGEVTQPGRFELKAWATVLEVLAMAGAFREFAARSRIVVLRGSGGRLERIPFNYDKAAAGGQANFYVHPGDIVMVP